VVNRKIDLSLRLPTLFWALLLIAAGAVSALAIDPPVKDALDSLAIWVQPGDSRPFLLANRTGTYFYGSTGNGWDSGWMGLWIHRKRVLDRIMISDSAGTPMKLESARSRVTPANILWQFPDDREISLFFAARQDTLYFSSASGLRVDGGSWILPAPTHAEPPLRRELINELHAHPFSCADTVMTKAVAWAQLQMLFMLAEDDSLLYAGIPWFNEGWGRDTFISLPGLLVTGHADAGRKIILRFASWMDRDSTSPTFGRIPNRVRPGEENAYNTADGTPWWILGAYQYSMYNRDTDLWSWLISDSSNGGGSRGALRVALQGALAHSDSLGFLKHGDADTWMDAVGPQGPVTPRGEKAVEIQALMFGAYDAVEQMQREGIPKSPLEAKISGMRQKLLSNFTAEYLTPSGDHFYDRITRSGLSDTLPRPNGLFALTLPVTRLVPPPLQSKIMNALCRDLIHPYGVLSLSPRSPLFHPFHMDEHYPKDDAYHNGVVWVWLSGPAKTALTREGRADLALDLANYEARLMLTRGCVGSLPELLDAMPRKGQTEPALSGTVSQTWSLAEFLRTTYQDFLGIRPMQVRNGRAPFWFFDPRIPESWGRTETRVTLNGTPVYVALQNQGRQFSIHLKAEVKPAVPIGIKAFDLINGVTGFLDGTDTVRIVWQSADSTVYADGSPTSKVWLTGWPYDGGNKELAFAAPIKETKFASLKDPDWDILTDKQVFPAEKTARPLLWMDDSTSVQSGYDYPTDEHFKPGILDITSFEIAETAKSFVFTLKFRDLVQPGWHPEYGFQLTYAAICLHTKDGKRQEVGANSAYVFPYGGEFSRVIYMGGGLCIEDDAGKKLASYIPRTGSPMLGDTATKTVTFSIPKKYFPQRDASWAWSVLVGAQDDHGGAGMGEFRTVKPVAEKWNGGGNITGGTNVYEILSSEPEKPKH
jgi:glycogen debranching enzyme